MIFTHSEACEGVYGVPSPQRLVWVSEKNPSVPGSTVILGGCIAAFPLAHKDLGGSLLLS